MVFWKTIGLVSHTAGLWHITEKIPNISWTHLERSASLSSLDKRGSSRMGVNVKDNLLCLYVFLVTLLLILQGLPDLLKHARIAKDLRLKLQETNTIRNLLPACQSHTFCSWKLLFESCLYLSVLAAARHRAEDLRGFGNSLAFKLSFEKQHK